MATVVGSSTGAIDVKSTVDQLIEVEMVKRIDPIDTKVTARKASLGALTQIRTLTTSLQDSIDAFSDTNLFAAAQNDPVTGAAITNTVQADALRLQNLTTAVKDFVTNYNAVQAAITKYSVVDLSDTTRDTPAKVALYGDPALRHFSQLMREGYSSGLYYKNTLTASDGAPMTGRADQIMGISFVELGVARKTDGTLSFSKTALQKSATAKTDNLDTTLGPVLTRSSDSDPEPRYSDSNYLQPKLLDRFALGVSGSIKRTNVLKADGSRVDVVVGFKAALAVANNPIVGELDIRSSQYNSQLYTLSRKRVQEGAKIESERTRLLKTYSGLNALLANMSSTSNFLTAQLASLSKNN
jgi:flagellar capping protein FliD